MSRGEAFKKLLFYVFLVVAAVSFLFFLLPRKEEKSICGIRDAGMSPQMGFEIKNTDEDEFSLCATVTKGKVLSFLGEKGVDISSFAMLLPEKLDAFCVCKIKSGERGGSICVEIKEARLGKVRLPQKVLSEIGEIDLDFGHLLVYN